MRTDRQLQKSWQDTSGTTISSRSHSPHDLQRSMQIWNPGTHRSFYDRPNEATEIFFIGMGNAFYGVANLLINRETLYQRVNGVISFVAENPVRAIASHTQVWLSRWYKEVGIPFLGSLGPVYLHCMAAMEANANVLKRTPWYSFPIHMGYGTQRKTAANRPSATDT